MTMIYKGTAITGTPAELIEALRTWAGYAEQQKTETYKRGVRQRAKVLYGNRIPLNPDEAFLTGLAELGEIYLIENK
jgi:hypothetical protein